MDVNASKAYEPLYVKHGDTQSRFFKLILTAASTAFIPPEGAAFSIHYDVAGHTGWYDTIELPDGSTRPAVTVEENELTCEIAEDATWGSGKLCVAIDGTDGYRLALWDLDVRTESVPAQDAPETKNYYNTALADFLEKVALHNITVQQDGETLVFRAGSEDTGETGEAGSETFTGVQLYPDGPVIKCTDTALAAIVAANYKTLSQEKAPAGYGYGGQITTTIYNLVDGATEADFNTLLEDVFSKMSSETAMQVQFLDPALHTSWVFTGTLYKNYSEYGWLRGTSYNGETVQKIKRENAWGEWEWVNPPMVPGVEYRTTKRLGDAPIYAIYLTVGYCNAGDMTITKSELGSSATHFCNIRVFNNNHEDITNSQNITHLAGGRYDGNWTISLSFAVAHGGIEILAEYTK